LLPVRLEEVGGWWRDGRCPKGRLDHDVYDRTAEVHVTARERGHMRPIAHWGGPSQIQRKLQAINNF
jgi:hypothetical protein